MSITQQIKIVQPLLEEITSEISGKIETIKEDLKNLSSAAKDFGENWLGEWASENYNHYSNFIGFEDEILILDTSEIENHINDSSNSSLEEIKKLVSEIMSLNNEFRAEVVTELSIIKGIDQLSSENKILEKIENQEWGITPQKYIEIWKPKTILTSNPEKILNSGLKTPPHLIVDGELLSLFSMVSTVQDFHKNVKRLLRQLELKCSDSKEGDIEISSDGKFVYQLIEKFHTVANQLRNRYSNRDTILITDEYDVQDLLHGLLKIVFEDVRPEEYTPSYAGSSTRVDFLLKKEKIVIEVKKTRKGLKDKQVGEQLILDTQHYKTHPDCKHLICFVYDPESRIRNPRGLENDLNLMSNEELLVEVFIRP